jgi:coenzyme Q-binding protein COQ10
MTYTVGEWIIYSMTRQTERRHSRYAPSQLFELVADVESYPDFVPWVRAARICRRQDNAVWVEMEVGTHLLRRRFTSRAVLHKPDNISISSHDPLFKRYEQRWTFHPAPQGDGTIVECQVDFEFRSRLLQAAMGASLANMTVRLIAAFLRRASELYDG